MTRKKLTTDAERKASKKAARDKWKANNPEKNAQSISAGIRKYQAADPKRTKAQRKKTKDKYMRKYILKQNYGMSLDDYNTLFQEQGGKCAICGVHQLELKQTLSVDHDHSTGQIRGLLCGNCNRALGMMKDDPQRLRCAVSYLGRYANE